MISGNDVNLAGIDMARQVPETPAQMREILLEDVTQDDDDRYYEPDADAMRHLPFEMIDPAELERQEQLIERVEALRDEMAPDLPEGYELQVLEPGPEDHPDHPVGVLRGPEEFEERFPDVSKGDEPRIETKALTHEDRVRSRQPEPERAEVGVRDRADGPSWEKEDDGVERWSTSRHKPDRRASSKRRGVYLL